MANQIRNQIQRLQFSATELKKLTNWNDRLIRDYLEITSDLYILADSSDLNNEQIEINKQNIAQNAADIAQNTNDINSNTSSINSNSINIAINAANIAQNTTDIAQNASDIAFLQRRVAGDFRLTTTNGVATIIPAVNTPVKLVTGGNDVASELSNVTKPADNRLEINEDADRDFLITGVVILSKVGGANIDYRVHVYMDGAPLPIPLFLERTVSNPQQVFVVNGSAMGITAGAHFFEMWVENLTNGITDPTWESGSMRIEVLK
jgi:hypothetical protein